MNPNKHMQEEIDFYQTIDSFIYSFIQSILNKSQGCTVYPNQEVLGGCSLVRPKGHENDGGMLVLGTDGDTEERCLGQTRGLSFWWTYQAKKALKHKKELTCEEREGQLGTWQHEQKTTLRNNRVNVK